MSALIERIFDAQIAHRGGLVRRKMSWLDEYGYREQFIAAARERHFPVLEIGDQIVVICSPNPHYRRIA